MKNEPSPPYIAQSLIKNGPHILKFTVIGKVTKIERIFPHDDPDQATYGTFKSRAHGQEVAFICMSALSKKYSDVLAVGEWLKLTLECKSGFGEINLEQVFTVIGIESAWLPIKSDQWR